MDFQIVLGRACSCFALLQVKGLVVKDSFHGRTFRAALLTDTTQSACAMRYRAARIFIGFPFWSPGKVGPGPD